ncbi:IDEAL domain-containing protein [Bacillus sp. FJAT-29814]|uniref:IDEAL domain-containing protein n=1 Tax=Bacillus sp. FJAT-29814 TaxID=1729688 RepID=UPI00082E4759|nr:IDEAL domain-containing protein [Bacillus sp. FJAT-29814]
MNSGKKDDLFAALLHAAMLASAHSKVEKILKESDERLSAEADQVMKEIEHFNRMNLINKALDAGDKESFMKLTGELIHA